MRKAFFEGTYLSAHEVDRLLKEIRPEVYSRLPAAGAQRMVLMMGEAWSSWLSALADFRVNPQKYRGKPKIPGYRKKPRAYVVSRNGYRIKDGMLHLTGASKFGFQPIKITVCDNQPFNAKKDETVVTDVRIIPGGTSFTIEIGYKVDVIPVGENPDLDPDKAFAIDLGIDNLVTMTSTQEDYRSLLISGKVIKSINNRYNKNKAELQERSDRKLKEAKQQHDKDHPDKGDVSQESAEALATGTADTSEAGRQGKGKKLRSKPVRRKKTRAEQKARQSRKHIAAQTERRNREINDYFHKTSRYIVKECLETGTGKIIIGRNNGWKQKVNMGRVNNQKFAHIPHARLIEMISYKAKEMGIEVILREESYTSKASALDLDPIPVYGEASDVEKSFRGKRVKRGLYRAASGRIINADVNGSANIMRKEIGDGWLKTHLEVGRGVVDTPVRIRHICAHLALKGSQRAVETPSK